jgi:hypothetical protein
MKVSTAGWFRVVAVTALFAAACGSPATGTATSGTRITPTFTNNPTPTVTAIPLQPGLCQAPLNRCLALVTLRGSNNVVVRDITDITHPKTIGNVGLNQEIQGPKFVSATVVSYANVSGVLRMPLVGSPKTVVAKSSQVFLFAWSPNGSTLAYISNSLDKSALHLVTGGQDRVVSSMSPFNGGCESESCAIGSDFRLLYSQDGHFISLVQPWGGPNFRLWDSDGKLLKSNEPANVSYSMSVWSGNGLYVVGADGVAVWRNAVVSSFLPSVRWIRPKGSAGGGQIVYAVRDRSGLAHTYIVDTTTRKVRELKSARSEPVFLTSRYIWYQGERLCVAADNCDPSFPVVTTGKTYIYDLQDGTETQSIITGVYDVWPHAA